MIMPRGSNQLLLPANPVFIWGSLLAAFSLNLIPLGRAPFMPDFLSLVIAFWAIHQPRRIGIGIAFTLGLLMDVHEAAILGQHALAYTLLSFFAIMIHRRVLWFSVATQAVQIFPLFLVDHLVMLGLRLYVDGGWPDFSFYLAPVFEALLWPVATWLLLAPQRRAPDPDKHRPL